MFYLKIFYNVYQETFSVSKPCPFRSIIDTVMKKLNVYVVCCENVYTCGYDFSGSFGTFLQSRIKLTFVVENIKLFFKSFNFGLSNTSFDVSGIKRVTFIRKDVRSKISVKGIRNYSCRRNSNYTSVFVVV